jgi:KDO2-lipid IV(A) lauroyltransferase
MKTLKRIFVAVLSIPLIVFLVLASLIPLRLLRLFTPVVNFLIKNVFGYRKKVVIQNLKKAFPEKRANEISLLAQKYYWHLSEIIIDSVGLITARKSTITRIAYFEDEAKQIIQKYLSSQKTFIVATAHYGNWEILAAVAHYQFPGYLVAGYRPMTNVVINALAYSFRKRFSHRLIPANKMLRQIVKIEKEGIPKAIALIADQWPPPKTATKVSFLGVETPFYNGIEKIARKYNFPVVFMSARKQPNGQYSIFVTEITSNPATMLETDITRKYAALLENEIKMNPVFWLWSHRRWK